jgi:hypothetical protein
MRNQINPDERKVCSQFGEDGILEELFHRIGTTNKHCVEFGAADGVGSNTLYLLAHKGWTGVLIEGDPTAYARLQANLGAYPGVRPAQHFLTPDNIAAVFQALQVPRECDLLSIDVDGNDYWLWRALPAYKPRVLVVEYNEYHRPPARWVMVYNPAHRWDGTSYYGASLASLGALGSDLGYALIGTESNGVNAFFLRQDCLALSGFVELSPEEAYHPALYIGLHGKPGHAFRDGPFVPL